MIYLYSASLITALALILGIILMAVGGKYNDKYSNKLMTLRVVSQALVIALLALAYYSKT